MVQTTLNPSSVDNLLTAFELSCALYEAYPSKANGQVILDAVRGVMTLQANSEQLSIEHVKRLLDCVVKLTHFDQAMKKAAAEKQHEEGVIVDLESVIEVGKILAVVLESANWKAATDLLEAIAGRHHQENWSVERTLKFREDVIDFLAKQDSIFSLGVFTLVDRLQAVLVILGCNNERDNASDSGRTKSREAHIQSAPDSKCPCDHN